MAQAAAATQQTDNVAHALAGAGGGLLSMTLTYPLITLSTRAQVESRRLAASQTLPSPPGSPSPSASTSSLEKRKQAATTTLAAARHIIRREGLSGLYSGLESALFGISITNFVYYYWYEWTRSFFLRAAAKVGRAGNRLTTAESMAAGAVAGAATVMITNPIWVVNTRMTAASSAASDVDVEEGGEKARERKKKLGTLRTLMVLLKEEGLKGLFKGVLPALVLVINPILQYTIFEQLRNSLLARKGKVGSLDTFYLGAIGKLAATGITYPYITVKSRMHVAKGKEGEREEGMGESLRRVVREEGWGALYKGIGPKISQSVITAAFLFAFKDLLYEASIKARKRVAQKLPIK